jgi:tetratricopeptide (TPR) repeat protein
MPTGTDLLAQAFQLHQAGRLAEAEHLYRQVLAAEPRHADARHLLGVAALQSGRHAEAVVELEQAIALNGNQAAYHNHLGIAAASLGRHELALIAFRRAIQLAPNLPDVHFNFANAQREAGDATGAIASFRRAVALKPNYAEAWFNLGNALRHERQLPAAMDAYRQAVRARPGYFKALLNMADALNDMGRLDEALTTCRRAVEIQPGSAKGHNNLGTLLRAKGDFQHAAESFQRALAIEPAFAEAHSNLGSAWLDLQRYGEAAACFERAVELNPRYAKAHNGLGAVRRALDDLPGAVQAFQQAIELDPALAEAHVNLGSALVDQGELAAAEAAFRQAIAVKPESAEAHFALASVRLLEGRLAEAWPHYEWRLKTKDHPVRQMRQPRWQGEPLEGRSILLLSEQGMGDTLQFVRYAALLRDRGAKVTLGCPPPLVRLLSSCPYLDHVASELGQQGFDYHAELLSLPAMLGTTIETIPADVPYLFADEALVRQWRSRLDSIKGLRIGIHWQGNPKYRGDRHRSLPLANFEPLARVPNVRLISLQRGLGAEQIARVANRFEVIELGDEVDREAGAFMDTAAIMRVLDLVITSDTATAHLAGALGVPVWMATPLAPDWRWLLEREDSPWYPTMRLFRQPKWGDWPSAFARMAAEVGRG